MTSPPLCRGALAASALLVLVSAPALRAQTAWTYAASEHFEVYTTGGDTVARRALEDFDRVHTFFERVLDLPPITGPRTRLIVFRNRKEFEPYAAHAAVKAFYQSSVDNDFIVMPALNDDAFPAVVHEYTHLVFRRTARRYPLWIADGLAEFYSTLTPQGAKLRLGFAPPERQRALGFGVRLMPLERLFTITRESAEYNTPSRAGLFYAESWALTHMLMTDDRYRDRSAALLAKLADGGPAALALNAVYGKPMDEIARDLSRYVQRGNYRTTLVDVALTAAAQAAASRPATDFEAGVALATLLAANPARQAEARAAFDTLERENPDDLFLIESRAMFAVRGGRPDEARPYLARAIALGSAKARIYSHYAEIIGASTGDDDRTDEEEALFAKALSLRPDDVEVRMLMARSLVRRRRGAEAMAVLAPVGRVPIEYEEAFAETRALAELHARERVADGRLTNIICDGDTRILEITTAGGILRLTDEGRTSYWTGTPAELPCGAQDRTVRAGYQDVADPLKRVDGTVLFVAIR